MPSRRLPKSPTLLCALAMLACAGCYKPNTENGAALFRKDCAGCHNPPNGRPAYVPSLVGYFTRNPQSSEKETRQRIINGGRFMPPFKERLNSHEVDDLIAYLKTQQ